MAEKMGTDLVGGVSLVAQAAVLLTRGGQAAQLAVLVNGVHNPVDARILQQCNYFSIQKR